MNGIRNKLTHLGINSKEEYYILAGRIANILNYINYNILRDIDYYPTQIEKLCCEILDIKFTLRKQIKRLYHLIYGVDEITIDFMIADLIRNGFLINRKITHSTRASMLYLSKWPRAQYIEGKSSGDIPSLCFSQAKLTSQIFKIDYILDVLIPKMPITKGPESSHATHLIDSLRSSISLVSCLQIAASNKKCRDANKLALDIFIASDCSQSISYSNSLCPRFYLTYFV